jgi:hypothetical protein
MEREGVYRLLVKGEEASRFLSAIRDGSITRIQSSESDPSGWLVVTLFTWRPDLTALNQ